MTVREAWRAMLAADQALLRANPDRGLEYASALLAADEAHAAFKEALETVTMAANRT